MKFRLICIALLMVLIAPAYVFSGSYTVDFILGQVKQKKLPDYCAYMGALYYPRTPEGRKLKKLYGNDWIHMHHYCWAIVDNQNGHAQQALGNLGYVLARVSQPRLRSLALEYKAGILINADRSSEAIPVYYELIQINPKAERGYLGLANIFLSSGDKNSAREIAKQGLMYLPESSKLMALLR